MSNSFWIIGFRAAGKTTFGRAVAEQLECDFLDLDEEWEKRSGTSIVVFVEQKGIEAFRREEEIILAEASALLNRGRRIIVATGGGFVDWGPSFAIVERSLVPKLYLDPPADFLWERLKGSPDRRKIGDLTSLSALQALLEKRRPFYEKIASIHWKDQDINGCLAALKSFLDR